MNQKYKPKISGYTTSRNSFSMGYPVEESITSLFTFADEVVVVDSSDGTDSTKEQLKGLVEKFGSERLKVFHQNPSIWKEPNHGIYDGLMKAKARSLCSGEWLWQNDLDEIVAEGSAARLFDLVEKHKDSNPLAIFAFPVVEFWGSKGKVRLDINLEKPRFSRNIPSITHGIPQSHRRYANGLLYANHGSDGCDYVDTKTHMFIPWVTCLPQNIKQIQHVAKTDKEAAVWLTNVFFNHLLPQNPFVNHYSWWSIERKIGHYKSFWTMYWKSLYGEELDERNNPFFPGRYWSSISDEEIKELANKLEEKTGGWVFHSPWDGSEINAMIRPS